MSKQPAITFDLLERLKSPKGGYSRASLNIMGISWPPPRGWRKKLIAEAQANLAKEQAPASADPITKYKNALHEAREALLSAPCGCSGGFTCIFHKAIQIIDATGINKSAAILGDSRTITVCDRCLRASCWQGDFLCENSKNAGTVEKTRAELAALKREDSHYWNAALS